MPAHVEREVKLRFTSPDEARAAVTALGAVPLRARRLQSDTVFDTPLRDLAVKAEVLRVRMEDGNHCVTFKSPLPDTTMKLREEIETSVGNGLLVMTIFERLGFVVSFRYEKYREEFALLDTVVAVDETPVGTFIEIEGAEQRILDITEALGRTPTEFVLDSYRSLFLQSCAARGVTATDMVFSR